MIGQHKLHKNLIQETLFPDMADAPVIRADRLDTLKDKIACRYYYYARLCRMLYQDCIRQLEAEFDLSERTIIENHLDGRQGFIQRLVDEDVTASELNKRYPWYDWGYRPR